MNTSRIDGVKAPQHRGTPRSRLLVFFFIAVVVGPEIVQRVSIVLEETSIPKKRDDDVDDARR